MKQIEPEKKNKRNATEGSHKQYNGMWKIKSIVVFWPTQNAWGDTATAAWETYPFTGFFGIATSTFFDVWFRCYSDLSDTCIATVQDRRRPDTEWALDKVTNVWAKWKTLIKSIWNVNGVVIILFHSPVGPRQSPRRRDKNEPW